MNNSSNLLPSWDFPLNRHIGHSFLEDALFDNEDKIDSLQTGEHMILNYADLHYFHKIQVTKRKRERPSFSQGDFYLEIIYLHSL